ncbi:hypothetical protein DSCA_58460 [Desulfosarcina alkanivorans]|uniref:Methyl-accepting chemotaxis protein n=1 Tax=Desulfosarcina alkanivorans TaxID=571177 RepID=A0A5K7YRM8_9BACT|nr:methyl-accepting chemotaxis protein [Desulfosarcina alkanivorans]BBO71916.1 hypothetical protein DSCA_58460 [Desulfosarcina alkanivorans]
MKFNNLKMGVKLGIGFTAVLLLTAVIALVGRYNMQKLSDMTEKLYRHPYAVTKAIVKVETDLVKIHRAMKDVALAKTDSAYDAELKKIAGFENEIATQIEVLRERFLGDQKQVEDLNKKMVGWRPIRAEVIDLMRKGDRAGAAAITKGKGATHVQSIVKAINAFETFAQSKADEFMENANRSRDRALNLTYTITAIAILMGAAVAFFLTRSIVTPLSKAVTLAETMSTGNFTQQLHDNRSDEIGVLVKALNQMAGSLRTMLQQIAGGVDTLSSASTELGAISTQMTQGIDTVSDKSNTVSAAAEEMNANMNNVAAAMEESATNTNMVATASEEMSSTIGEIAQNAEKARGISDDAARKSSNASANMDQLGTAANSIGKVIETITDISEQVNLLALNATIEAARAGEAGKGFAVVANEIKELAKQTADATQDIKEKIEDIQGTTSMTVGQITEITEVITDVNDVVTNIASAVEQQSAATKEIVANVAQASQGIQEVNENVNQSASVSGEISRDISDVSTSMNEMSTSSSQVNLSAQELSQLSENLKQMVDQFRI